MQNLVLSTEKINDIQTCPKLYNYKHNLRKTPNTKFAPLETGELMHYSLASYYEGLKDPSKTLSLESIISLTRNYAAEKLSIISEEVEQVIKDFRLYYNHYAHSETWQIDAVEEPFAKILWESNDLRVVVTGKIDLRVTTMNGKGPRALIDHKYEARFDQKPDRDNQPLCYAWAYGINDWMFNRIGKQKSTDPKDRLQRPYICYSQHQIDGWVESAIETALDIYRCYEREVFPARMIGCNYHKRRCDFYDVCNTSADNQEYKLNTMFKNRPDSTLMEGEK